MSKKVCFKFGMLDNLSECGYYCLVELIWWALGTKPIFRLTKVIYERCDECEVSWWREENKSLVMKGTLQVLPKYSILLLWLWLFWFAILLEWWKVVVVEIEWEACCYICVCNGKIIGMWHAILANIRWCSSKVSEREKIWVGNDAIWHGLRWEVR